MIVAECDVDTMLAALESAKPYVCEIVVAIDPSSTAALAIARDFGCTIVEYTWDANFSNARNAAVERCTGDWILSLDADEIIQVDSVKELLIQLSIAPALYSIRVYSNQGDGHSVINDTTRLFPNRPTIRYKNRLHETPTDSEDSLAALLCTHLHITHAGYTAESIEKGQKVARNLGMLQEMLIEQPLNPQLRLYVAQSLHDDGNIDSAADWLRLCMHFCRIHAMSSSQYCYDQAAADLLSILSTATHYAQGVVEARAICAWREPTHPAFHINLSNCQLNCGDFYAAMASAVKAKQYRGANLQQTDQAAVTWLPDMLLGMCHSNLEQWTEAVTCYTRALAFNPTHHKERVEELLAAVQNMLY